MNNEARYLSDDALFDVFERELKNTSCIKETTEEFIYRVVETYVMKLLENAHVPIVQLAQVQEDLEEEVRQMLQKSIYGHFSLEAYRKAL